MKRVVLSNILFHNGFRYENEMLHILDISIDAEKLKENSTSYPEVFRVLEIIRPNWQKKNIRVKVRIIIFTLVNVNALAKARTYRLRQFQRHG